MKKNCVKARDWTVAKVNGDNTLSYFVKLVFLLFSNEYVKTIVSFVGPVVIGLLSAVRYFGPIFWIICVIYIFAVLLITWASSCLKKEVQHTQLLKQALIGIDIVLRTWGVLTQKCLKRIKNLSVEKNKQAIEKFLTEIDFQAAAFTVCENLCERLSKYCENDNVYATLYQRYENNGVQECKMIAFSGNHEPSSYNDTYVIPEYHENLFGKIEYHTFVFASDNTEITTFCNHEEVDAAFVMHKRSIEREENIQQYICVPIALNKQGVTFLLQVDTSVPELFGSNCKDIDRFAKTAIYPFAQFLHMMYEQQRTIEFLIK